MKKILAVLLTISLLTQSTVLFAFSANEKISFKDAWLNFEPWTGSGTVSVSIGDDYLTKDLDIVSFDEFEELRYESDDETLDYTVSELNGNTIITINEDYLKTLDDGTYYLEAEFSRAIIPLKLFIIKNKVELKDFYFNFDASDGNGSAQVKLSNDSVPFTFESALFNSLKYCGKEVESSNYSVSQFMNILYITLKEEYVKTLPDGVHYFEAEFLNISVMLKLTIKRQSQPPAITDQPITTTVLPAKPSVAKVKKVIVKNTSKKRQLKVTWQKINSVEGYQVKASFSKKFKAAKKYNTVTKTLKKNKKSAMVKVKKSSKKYYVKVRAYKTYKNAKGETVKAWGKWSNVKSGRAK